MRISKAIFTLEILNYYDDTLDKDQKQAITKGIESLQKQLQMSLLDVYPYNLALSIAGDEKTAIKLSAESIESQLNKLEERQQRILQYRFKEKLTLEKTGQKEGLTRERIRQIEAKALRLLRHPSRIAKMRAYTYAEIVTIGEERNQLRKDNQYLKKAIKKLTNKKVNMEEIEEMVLATEIEEQGIEELGLSVRAYNALRRRGIRTIGEVIDLTEKDLSEIRNLGSKSREEIKNALKELQNISNGNNRIFTASL